MQNRGQNYWEKYALVINWLSARTMLILSMLYDLETRSIDFTLVFPLADLDVDVYTDLPVGFEDTSVKKNIVLKQQVVIRSQSSSAHSV